MKLSADARGKIASLLPMVLPMLGDFTAGIPFLTGISTEEVVADIKELLEDSSIERKAELANKYLSCLVPFLSKLLLNYELITGKSYLISAHLDGRNQLMQELQLLEKALQEENEHAVALGHQIQTKALEQGKTESDVKVEGVWKKLEAKKQSPAILLTLISHNEDGKQEKEQIKLGDLAEKMMLHHQTEVKEDE